MNENDELIEDENIKKFNEVLVEISWKNLESHYNRFKDIDSKAIGVITITGILITFLTKPVDVDYLTKTTFIITMLLFLITIVLSILVIRTRIVEAVSTENLIKLPRNEKEISRIIGTIAATETNVCDVANKKAKDLRWSIYSLGISIILLIIYSILSL